MGCGKDDEEGDDGEGEEDDEFEGGDVQNHASLMVEYCGHSTGQVSSEYEGSEWRDGYWERESFKSSLMDRSGFRQQRESHLYLKL